VSRASRAWARGGHVGPGGARRCQGSTAQWRRGGLRHRPGAGGGAGLWLMEAEGGGGDGMWWRLAGVCVGRT
jgi:hypothetical protein